MARCYKFSLVRLTASAPRDERLNIGIAVFDEDRLDVRLARSLGKLHAISLAYDPEVIRSAAEALIEIDRQLFTSDDAEGRLERLRQFCPFDLSPLAYFTAPSRDAYEQEIGLILRSFVDPEPAPLKARKGKSTHLTSALRKAFKGERVLALKGEDLSAHRVIANLELATGLVADFVLKNGAMHIIETVDAAGENVTARKVVSDIALSALTIEQARITYGEAETIGRLVYQASAQTEGLANSALLAAEHQGIELLNWASGDDQRRLLTTVSSLAQPVPKGRKLTGPENASTQHRFEIN